MRALLTGGAGYIGSHVALELLERGHEVVVIDDLSNSSRESLRRVEELSGRKVDLYVADLSDIDATREIFVASNPDAVIHLAGLKAVGESVADPIRYYRTNLGCTFTLVQVMREFRVKRLVFSSSATVYGTISDLPVSESSVVGQGITNPYGQTKAMIEQILQDVAVTDPEMQLTILRYFNPIGAHESGRIGEDPRQVPNNLLPFVSQVAAGVREEVSVFGDGFATPDGTGVRDYVHVVDLARGHVAALEASLGGVRAFNLGTGHGSSVLQVIKAFSRVARRSIPYKVVAPRLGDVAVSYGNVVKAAEELGWVAQRTLEDACRDAWRWQLANPYGYSSEANSFVPERLDPEPDGCGVVPPP